MVNTQHSLTGSNETMTPDVHTTHQSWSCAGSCERHLSCGNNAMYHHRLVDYYTTTNNASASDTESVLTGIRMKNIYEQRLSPTIGNNFNNGLCTFSHVVYTHSVYILRCCPCTTDVLALKRADAMFRYHHRYPLQATQTESTHGSIQNRFGWSGNLTTAHKRKNSIASKYTLRIPTTVHISSHCSRSTSERTQTSSIYLPVR